MIYSSIPVDWRDLQEKVTEVFREIGVKTEVNKGVKTARGHVNIDVYAEDKSQSPNLLYLCECKYWNKRVPQTVVHSFRTVVNDFGANYGLLISKQGFQAGSFDAARNTNIKLLDWNQFQNLFEDKWFQKYMCPTLCKECGPLVSYTEPINSTILKEADKLDDNKRKRFKQLRQKHSTAAYLTLRYYAALFGESVNKPVLALQKDISSELMSEVTIGNVPLELIKATGLRDFLVILLGHCRQGIHEFDNLFGKKIRD